MKIKSGFIMREIAGDYIVVPTGEAAVSFNGLITVNEVGKLLWDELISGADEELLVDRVFDEYEVDRETAAMDVKEFVARLQAAGILEE